MDDEEVRIEIVLYVLRAYETLATCTDETKNQYMISGETGFLEEIVLGDPVNKRHLQRFKRLLKIPIDHFWHPERCPKANH